MWLHEVYDQTLLGILLVSLERCFHDTTGRDSHQFLIPVIKAGYYGVENIIIKDIVIRISSYIHRVVEILIREVPLNKFKA
ncbi:hypothetical protein CHINAEXTREME_09010 [Halobiforma lacisalsi AJ5]|uniref:Uncharacterized protein n=1 Tax=Natronobacterium lacisalsi AJ5 TaxID=358396 RepID=M0L9N1_NATLA|nr:hypothetical protein CHINAEXTREME_09010 [Halobiforma lacisalsi AJ5]EMA29179.1 hypothetical protein C445_17574 [Halobiforma lacisalsi AJ5]